MRWLAVALVGCPSKTSSSPDDPTPTTPATTPSACDRGRVDCDGACVDLFDDVDNCGSCGTPCATGESCGARVCDVPVVDCTFPGSFESCDGRCVETSVSLDACGACDAACADDESCLDGVCTPNGSDGRTCATAIGVPSELELQFWLDGAGSHQATCGPATPRPARFYRFTAPADGAYTARVVGDPDRDDLVLEAFTAVDCSASRGCNDSALGLLPELSIEATAGETVVFVVSAGAAGVPAGRLLLTLSD
ncbi:MAG: hypothetical protein ABMA64_07475 [Myxococcota bacterium]